MRVLVWVVLLYLLADFCDAGLPGAFEFNADESVEVVRAEQPTAPTDPMRTATAEPRHDLVRPTSETRVSNAALVSVAVMTGVPPPLVLAPRPRSPQLSSEDSPAASAAV